MSGPMPGGHPLPPGRWCEQHGRHECTRQRSKSRGDCHGTLIPGLDACRMHVGKSGEAAKAQGQANLMLAAAMAQAPRVHPGEVLLKAGHAAHVLLDGLLADTPSAGATIAQLELLVAAIDRAARIAKAALDADTDARWVAAQSSVVARDSAPVVELLREVLVELGRDDDEGRAAVARVVRRRAQAERDGAA